MRRAVWMLVAAGIVFGVTVLPAEARVMATVDYGSGVPAAPLGTPVVSTVPYTAISDVLIVGDSITVRGYKDLSAALPGKRLAVNAWSGRNTKLSVDAVLAMPYLPPVLIMAVGSNDVMSPFAMPAQVARLLAGVPESTKVYWVDVQVARPKYPADQRNTMVVNKAIWQGCVGDCTVISWASFLAAKPTRLTAYLDAGGVHPIIGTGTKCWAAWLAAGIA